MLVKETKLQAQSQNHIHERDKQHSTMFSFLILIAITAIGTLSMILATAQWGIGCSHDSVVFMSTAQSLLQGQGFQTYSLFTGEFTQLTHFPPLYPMELAGLASIIGGDVAQAARWLNIGLFAANLLLIGTIIRTLTPTSRWLPALGAFLLLTSYGMIMAHATVWTEPLFLLLGFGGLFILARYKTQGGLFLFVTSALLVGFAAFVRYPGVILIATAGIELLFFGSRRFWLRLRDALVFGVIAWLPLVTWVLRNMLVAGNATNRELVFHPITLWHIKTFFYTLATWILPYSERFTLTESIHILIVGSIGLLPGIVLLVRERQRKNLKLLIHYLITSPMQRILSSFILVYMLFLVVSISILDFSTPLDFRILLPVYVALVVLVCSLIYHLSQHIQPSPRVRKAGMTVGIVMLALFTLCGFEHFTVLAQEGRGYSGKAWHDSGLIQAIKTLPPEMHIYTNAYAAVYLITGNRTFVLPHRTDTLSGKPNISYHAELTAIKKEIDQHQAVVVHFDAIKWKHFPTKQEIQEEFHMQPVLHVWDGVVYADEDYAVVQDCFKDLHLSSVKVR